MTLIEPGHLTWPQFLEKLTINPAKILGIDRGTLQTGKDADVTIIDPTVSWKIDPAQVSFQEPQYAVRRHDGTWAGVHDDCRR